MKKLRVNIASESEISVQGHGVHTAYVEMVEALKKRPDIEVITGRFGERVDCDVVHLHTVGPRMWRKLLQKGPAKVISAHVVPDSFVGSLILAKYWKPLAVAYLRWFYNRADLLLAVSEETKRDLEKMGVKAPIEILHNFIDTSRYKEAAIPRAKIREELGIPAEAFVVIGAGQVQPRKRVDSFFEAAKQLPDVYFVWIGGIPFGKVAAASGEMASMMKNPPKNVIFPGIVPLEKMPSYYHAADMFFLPSDQETFGLVVIEAAAAGLPVMLRDIPDYDDTFGADALKGKNNGDFCAHITTLASDRQSYQGWKRRAEALAARFDGAAAADRLVKSYRQLV